MMFAAKRSASAPVAEDPKPGIQTYDEWFKASREMTRVALDSPPNDLFRIERVAGGSLWGIKRWGSFADTYARSSFIAKDFPYDDEPKVLAGYLDYAGRDFDSQRQAELWLLDNLRGPESVAYDASGNRIETEPPK